MPRRSLKLRARSYAQECKFLDPVVRRLRISRRDVLGGRNRDVEVFEVGLYTKPARHKRTSPVRLKVEVYFEGAQSTGRWYCDWFVQAGTDRLARPTDVRDFFPSKRAAMDQARRLVEDPDAVLAQLATEWLIAERVLGQSRRAAEKALKEAFDTEEEEVDQHSVDAHHYRNVYRLSRSYKAKKVKKKKKAKKMGV